MFGSKLRSWMEAVRPRKKQHRKEKHSKSNLTNANNALSANNWHNGTSCRSSQNDLSMLGSAGNPTRKVVTAAAASGVVQTNPSSSQTPATSSRYSANNLSSPESAYSTGYSTDGTSPGAPPDYYINIKTEGKNHDVHPKYIQQHREIEVHPCLNQPPTGTMSPCTSNVTVHQTSRRLLPHMTQDVDIRVLPSQSRAPTAYPSSNSSSGAVTSRLTEVIPSPVLTSPRQRNRIRTNPWVPGGSPSPGQIRQEITNVTSVTTVNGSPISRKFLSPSSLRSQNLRNNQSLSSSSCSSISGASLHWDPRKGGSGSEEDDCTLNEMMGKYDESYVYEKETDILSDSDPTDCDTDIDTGQDGGDEDDPLEREFDFIDNGSYLELDPREDRNTGHCTYYNFEVQRRSSRRKTTRRNKQTSEKRRRSSSNKKRHKQAECTYNAQQNGSKSAGATPLSVRRTKHHPVSKLALEDCLKKRSNSVSFSRDPISTIDKRDKEADRKYKELIVEAEHILRSMKINGLSPHRVPGPANKRVEILRSTECPKPELFMKNRLMDDFGAQFCKTPSSSFNCPRFSPKKNHITNFMINNSPVLLRRDAELPTSPLVGVKKPEPPQFSRNHRHSPKYRKKLVKTKLQGCSSSSTDSEDEGTGKVRDVTHSTKANSSVFGCPQSEPVRRKVYGGGHNKSVAFNHNCENVCNNNSPPYSPTRFEQKKKSAENLRQQVLLNTIANLKRSLEDQSASLKQVYRSSHNIHL